MSSRHQRGYIFEASGAFHVRYYVMVDGERKQKSHRLCTKNRNTGHGSPSSTAVRELCEEFMRTINTGLPEQSTSTIADFYTHIYLPFIKDNLKSSTVQGYEHMWKKHLQPHYGVTLLKDYKTPMGSLFLTALAKKYRPQTLKHVKNISSGIFMHAVNTGHAEFNPWHDCKVLGKMLPNRETQSYTLEEIENVISALVDRVECQLIMAIAFFLGLRRGEIRGLQWADFDDNYCHVRRSFFRGVCGTPKTKKSIRSVPLIAPVRLLLKLWRAKSSSTLWVFPNSEGNPTDITSLAERVIRPALKKEGIAWKGFHAGRRGLGTALRTLTGNSNAGRDVLGHATTQVTEQHYESAMPEEALKGMRLLEERVKSAL